MTQNNKHMTAKEAWQIAVKLAAIPIIGNIEKVAELIKCAASTVYRWKDGGKKRVDGYIAMNLKELASKHSLIEV